MGLRCRICGSTNFSQDDGDSLGQYICNACGTLSQDVRNEEAEASAINFMGRTVTRKKPKGPKLEAPSVDVGECIQRYLTLFRRLLRMQATELIECCALGPEYWPFVELLATKVVALALTRGKPNDSEPNEAMGPATAAPAEAASNAAVMTQGATAEAASKESSSKPEADVRSPFQPLRVDRSHHVYQLNCLPQPHFTLLLHGIALRYFRIPVTSVQLLHMCHESRSLAVSGPPHRSGWLMHNSIMAWARVLGVDLPAQVAVQPIATDLCARLRLPTLAPLVHRLLELAESAVDQSSSTRGGNSAWLLVPDTVPEVEEAMAAIVVVLLLIYNFNDEDEWRVSLPVTRKRHNLWANDVHAVGTSRGGLAGISWAEVRAGAWQNAATHRGIELTLRPFMSLEAETNIFKKVKASTLLRRKFYQCEPEDARRLGHVAFKPHTMAQKSDEAPPAKMALRTACFFEEFYGNRTDKADHAMFLRAMNLMQAHHLRVFVPAMTDWLEKWRSGSKREKLSWRRQVLGSSAAKPSNKAGEALRQFASTFEELGSAAEEATSDDESDSGDALPSDELPAMPLNVQNMAHATACNVSTLFSSLEATPLAYQEALAICARQAGCYQSTLHEAAGRFFERIKPGLERIQDEDIELGLGLSTLGLKGICPFCNASLPRHDSAPSHIGDCHGLTQRVAQEYVQVRLCRALDLVKPGPIQQPSASGSSRPRQETTVLETNLTDEDE
ncbi:uncharacterized protein MONBRDRAFT_23400 [Monosiga brevicollis MX1]|uniref:GATA-type domain-containing protein n=1 Tax=Monosiga brevicollis TaxID=81824 RepID=A9UTA3_MONBE|nr:uncharacterized protein MONBRDRAFT_23400 [Monosiga brevicollis MX1]EDQ91459.1 predicted protein [Monosiga brevicollis MX1]|eukprot:XP_001743881.1 hypothetical protein [Monosiga brevicollis MX1]